MIPFGSQRALGQDLATHLMNTHDNERMEPSPNGSFRLMP